MLTQNNISIAANAARTSFILRGFIQPCCYLLISGDFKTAKDVTISLVNPPPDYLFLMPDETYDRRFTTQPKPPAYTVTVQANPNMVKIK
jgi:hypothetical protein